MIFPGWKYISFVMVIVMFAVAVVGTRCACASAPGATSTKGKAATSAQKAVPTSPEDDHSTPQHPESDSSADHSDCSSNCPCHAPLTVHAAIVTNSPLIALLNYPEPFQALPEVYLSKFVPPHILA